MAELTRNLKLRLSSGLTADARYNLEQIDTLGSTFNVDTTDTLRIRSVSDITIEPESSDIGGSGSGGSLSIGSVDHSLSSFSVFADTITLTGDLSLPDSASGGTKALVLKYNSTLDGLVDLIANRILSMDLNGADRSLILGGNFSLLGGSLAVTMPASQSYSYPIGYGTPGQVWAGDGAGSWAWTDMSGGGGGGDVSGYATAWTPGDGTTKVVTHSLLSNNVQISVFDDLGKQVLVDDSAITSANIVTLTSSEAPTSNWSVVIQAKQ